MNTARKIILAIALISFSNNSLTCDVCVIEPLLTSSIKCPRCDTTCDQQTNGITNEMENFYPVQNQSNSTCMETETISCDNNSRYRTIDGTCNNLKHPSWGKSGSPYLRLLSANYGDGISSVTLASNGESLPLVRKIRTELYPEKELDDKEFTLLAMQWGQIVAHDLLVSLPIDVNADCCNRSTENFEDICLPIIVPDDDPFYSKFNVTCVNEFRSVYNLVPDTCCNNLIAGKLNNNTPIMDGSLIYGSLADTEYSLREFKNGRLIIQKSNDNRDFLPNLPNSEKSASCFIRNIDDPCFVAGDTRVNQNTELTVLQTVFLREHNRIANKLYSLHKNWNDEKIYQETRNIIIAILQHVSYKELLPIYIGKHNTIKYNLYPLVDGYTKYNCKIKPMVLIEFASSAYRFGHSGIQGQLRMFDYNRHLQNSLNISDFTRRPYIILQNKNYDEFLLGLTKENMEDFDRFFTEQMTNLLMHQDNIPYGSDLQSLDIQRGRDHGLAPYVQYLEMCTGYKARTFEDLHRYIPENLVSALKQLYRSVKDIDLHVGGTLEKINPPAKFGPTFLCIIIEQFYRTKFGDRFWYEVGHQKHSFTPAQLQEIRKATLSRLICDNSDNITTIARNSFRLISQKNPIVNCRKIPSINLDMWK